MSAHAKQKRSSSLPKITIGVGIIAASTAAVSLSNESSDMAGGEFVAKALPGAGASTEHRDNDEAAGITFSVDEEWDAKRHGPELKRLIMKKARNNGILPDEEARLLSTLQNMRRAVLPLNMSYEGFVRERNRIEALKKVMDAMVAYKWKYGMTRHVQKEKTV